jgi:hypothetical protein
LLSLIRKVEEICRAVASIENSNKKERKNDKVIYICFEIISKFNVVKYTNYLKYRKYLNYLK